MPTRITNAAARAAVPSSPPLLADGTAEEV